MIRLLKHARGNAIAYLALFVALGGTSYAAFKLPANSVGTRQLRNHSVTPIKLDSGKIRAYVWSWVTVGPGGAVVASQPRGARVSWDPNSDSGVLNWGPGVPGSFGRPAPWGCFPEATGTDVVIAHAIPYVPVHGSKGEFVEFETFTPSGQHDGQGNVNIAVLCPQP
jgi:hypothetical protein